MFAMQNQKAAKMCSNQLFLTLHLATYISDLTILLTHTLHNLCGIGRTVVQTIYVRFIVFSEVLSIFQYILHGKQGFCVNVVIIPSKTGR